MYPSRKQPSPRIFLWTDRKTNMRLLTFLAISVFLCNSAIAEEQQPLPDIPKPLKVMPSKIKPVQDDTDELSKAAPETKGQSDLPADYKILETLTLSDTQGYQTDFWNTINYKELETFLSKTGTISWGKGIREINVRATITPAPSLTSSDTPPGTLYGLRLQRLGDLGDFEAAQSLYKMNESAPPTPIAARAGVEAMFGSGEIGLACLEQKALNKDLKTDQPQFWANADLFCQALLSPVAGSDKDLRLGNAARIYLEATKPAPPANINELNNLDILTTIALAKTGKLSSLTNSPESLISLSDKQAATLLEFLPNTVASLPVWGESLKRGIAKGADIIARLPQIDLSGNSDNYTPFLREYMKDSPPVLTGELLGLADTDTKKYLLIPLYTAPEVSFPEDRKALTLTILGLSNQEIPANIVRSAYSASESSENDTENGEALLINKRLEREETATGGKESQLYALLLALKSGVIPRNEQNSVYENILSLTAKYNYVMPTSEVLSNLKKSAEKKQIDRVIVNSLEVLTDTPPDKLSPAALYEVLEALNSAGLTEETVALTRNVLGSLLEK